MSTLNKIIFTIKEAFSGLIKNLPKSTIQLAVCFVSLTFFSFIYGVNANVQDVAKNMRSQIEISIFLKDDISDADFDSIEKKITNDERIKSFTFTSREEARQNGIELLDDYPEMLESLSEFDDHPFPASFTIELNDVTQTELIAEEYSNMSGIEQDGVKYGEEYMDKIISLSSGLQYGSVFALIFFFVIAVFFMISIINIIISAKDKQCSIMFLIGASPSQIRIPFYIQGTLIGLIASMMSYFTFKFFYQWIISKFGFSFVDIVNSNSNFFLFILAIGVLTGLVATKIALNKFNKLSKHLSKSVK